MARLSQPHRIPIPPLGGDVFDVKDMDAFGIEVETGRRMAEDSSGRFFGKSGGLSHES